MRSLTCCLVMTAVLSLLPTLRADTFTIQEENGTMSRVEARLAGTGQGALILELADGQYKLVAEGQVLERKPGDGPKPMTHDEVAAALATRFGEALFRSNVQEPYVMGLVLGSPLPKASEGRAKNMLRKAANFFKNVDVAFGSFAKEVRLPIKNPTFPLVILIFETEEDFEKYTTEGTGGNGLSASRIAGFYSGVTNYLAIRLSECNTFDVPLHEAIHQQVYNRNMFRRLSPVPHWFDEGIATGFESNQGQVNIGPTKISTRYAKQALAARELSWSDMMGDDSVFAGDVLAGEAYGHAWSLHWLLVSKYRVQYSKYVRMLAEKEPLQKDTAETRMAEFKEAFGKDLTEFESDFKPALETGIKRQKVVLNPVKPAGVSKTSENMGEVELSATNYVDEGRLEVQGVLRNTSPIRAMAYHVTVETESGMYAEWHFPSLDVQKQVPLPAQNVTKRMLGAPGGRSQTFRVHVRSLPAGSEQADAWKTALPVPEFGR